MQRQITAIAALAAIAPITGFAQSDSKALELVRKALDHDWRTPYIAIRLLKTLGSSEAVKVRRDQSGNGQNAVVVLSPLCKQGEMSIDDGKSWVQYFPDRRTLIIQTSPLALKGFSDFSLRFELLKGNYVVTSDGTETVAGRRSTKVCVKPLASEALYTRRYWIDNELFVLLRIEWTHPNGTATIVSDTLSIEFPGVIDPDRFKTKLVGQPKMINIQAPVRHNTIASLSEKVGFQVVLPVRMPYGFRFTGADAITANDRSLAALRYTDGATNVTVYEAKADPAKPPWRLNESRGDFILEGIALAVEGDLPDVGRAAILQALKASPPSAEQALASRAAAMFGVPVSKVSTLRGYGFGFDEVIACLVLSKRDDELQENCVKYIRAGKTLAEMARLMGAKAADVKRQIEKFLNMR